MMTAGIVDQSTVERVCKSKEREGLEGVSGGTKSRERQGTSGRSSVDVMLALVTDFP